MPGLIDVFLVLVLFLVTFFVAQEGVWHGSLMAIIVILAGLLAMNVFEPLSNQLESIGLTGAWSYRVDFLALVGTFAATVGTLRLLAYRLSPEDFVLNEAFEGIGRWLAGFLTGWVTMAFLLTALHTAPAPREFLGFAPERRNLLNLFAPDRQWLGFVQYCSQNAFSIRETVVVDGEEQTKHRVFDGAYLEVPGSEQRRWPSFPMRYATRREQLAGPALPAPSRSAEGANPDAPPPAGAGNVPPPDF